MKKVRVMVQVTEEELRYLDERAARVGKSRAWVVRRLVEEERRRDDERHERDTP